MLTEDIVRKIVAKFQYPRSGNLYQINMDGKVFDASMTKFQSPRSGNLYQINMDGKVFDASMTKFQSPRSGKFVSNLFLFF